MASKLGAGLAGLVLAIPLLIAAGVAGVVGALTGSGSSSHSLTCTPTPDGAPTGTVPGFTDEQISNAATIVAVGKQMDVPEQGRVVAIAAAIQESQLRNLHYGDRDSLGLFQQRPSMGWGQPDQITTPPYAATKFFEHLTANPRWQHLSVNDAAQHVQGSSTPDAYGQHEDQARAIAAAVARVRCEPAATAGTGDCSTIQAPTPAAITAITYACRQRGIPYVWGGDGARLTERAGGQMHRTGGFDCSGLTRAAYAAAGVAIPRTAQTQYDAGPRVPTGRPILPGDLVFFGSSPSAVTHVGIATSTETMIDAPHAGAVVQIERIGRSNLVGTTRPATVPQG